MDADIGVIGLAVMGSNLARNFESRGFKVAVYNRSTDVTNKFMQDFGKGTKGSFVAGNELKDFVASLRKPRKMIVMVKAGGPVDAVLKSLSEILEPGDLVMDGGNSHFKDTLRREADYKAKGLQFLGVGISGGEEGALHGPSIMPGGPKSGYDLVAPMLEKIAAQAEGKACTTYIGPDGAGHFVKTVHNGIEYGDMQLIAEAYHLLTALCGLTPEKLAPIFDQWNKGPLSSFLIEITSKIFLKKDDQGSNEYLVDKILDKAGQKGTGRWTLMEAVELGISIPTLAAALDARVLSSMKQERVHASEQYSKGQKYTVTDRPEKEVIDLVHNALYASKIMAYAQGMALLAAASKEYKWDLKLGEIASIWRGGCIIRAKFLNDITNAYNKNSSLANLVLDQWMQGQLEQNLPALRQVVQFAAAAGVPIPAFASSLNYFEAYIKADLPQNLTQAQRDFFGAHTFERKDKAGVFHAQWE